MAGFGGRAQGSKNKATLIKEMGVKTAIAACVEGGMAPPEMLVEMARWLKNVAALRSRQHQDLALMPVRDLELIVKLMMASAHCISGIMPYAYARLAAVEVTGANKGPIQHEHQDISARDFLAGRIAGLVERGEADQAPSGTH